MSNINSSKALLTKEQLLDCLEQDGIEVDEDMINEAKENDGATLCNIGFQYGSNKKDYSKAMAWYQLAAYQNHSGAQNNIGSLYAEGHGVSRDYDIAMEYFLKGAGNGSFAAMLNIGFRFLGGELGVPVDKYKALEWFSKSGRKIEPVQQLNDEGVDLKEEDKKKTVYQLVIETEDIIRNEKKKKEELKTSNEKEQQEIQKLRNELQQTKQQIDLLEQKEQQNINDKELLTQSNGSVENQLKDKEESINSLKREIEVYKMLVQSKNSEIDLLKRNNQREHDIIELKRKIEEYQRCSQEPTTFDQ